MASSSTDEAMANGVPVSNGNAIENGLLKSELVETFLNLEKLDRNLFR